MKKFMIFLLMAFLYLGTCQARGEAPISNDRGNASLLNRVSLNLSSEKFKYNLSQDTRPGGPERIVTGITALYPAGIYCGPTSNFWISFSPTGTAVNPQNLMIEITVGGVKDTLRPGDPGISNVDFNLIKYTGPLNETTTFRAIIEDEPFTGGGFQTISSTPIIISVVTPPSISLNYNQDNILCTGSSVNLIAEVAWGNMPVGSSLRYTWNNNGTATNDTITLNHTNLPAIDTNVRTFDMIGSQNYVLTITNVYDGAGIEATTCRVSDTAKIIVYDDPTHFFKIQSIQTDESTTSVQNLSLDNVDVCNGAFIYTKDSLATITPSLPDGTIIKYKLFKVGTSSPLETITVTTPVNANIHSFIRPQDLTSGTNQFYTELSYADSLECLYRSENIEINVFSQPQYDTIADFMVCDSNSVEITPVLSSYQGPVLTYQWLNNDLEIGTDLTQSLLITETVNNLQFIASNDAFVCRDTLKFTITKVEKPEFTLPGNFTACAGLDTNLVITLTNPIPADFTPSYSWTAAGFTPVSGTDTNLHITGASVGGDIEATVLYTAPAYPNGVVAQGVNQCTTTNNMEITIVAPPTITVQAPLRRVCSPDAVETFTVSFNNLVDGVDYNYTIPSDSIVYSFTANDTVHEIMSSTIGAIEHGRVTVSAADSSIACSVSYDSITVIVYNKPLITNIPDSIVACSGFSATYAPSFLFETGVKYKASMEYDGTTQYLNSYNDLDSGTVYTASAISSTDVTLPTYPVTFNLNPYYWSDSDSLIPSSCAVDTTVYLKMITLPTLSANPDSIKSCANVDTRYHINLTTTFSDTTGSHASLYYGFDLGTPPVNINSPMVEQQTIQGITANTTAYYVIDYRYASLPTNMTVITNCLATDSTKFIIINPPTIVLSPSNVMCSDGDITATATISNVEGTRPYYYTWSSTNNSADSVIPILDTVIALSTNTLPFVANGIKTAQVVYTLTVTDSNACSATSNLTVNTNPRITSFDYDLKPCANETTTLTATIQGGEGLYQYKLSLVDLDWGVFTSDTIFTRSVSNTNDIEYVLEVRNANNTTCLASASKIVEIVPNPVSFSLKRLGTPICYGNYLSLGTQTYTTTTDTANPQIFTWGITTNETDSSSITDIGRYSPIADGKDLSYRVLTDSTFAQFALGVNTQGYNCPLFAFSNVVEIHPSFDLTLLTAPDTICTGGSVTIQVQVANQDIAMPIQYRWYKNNLLLDGNTYETTVGNDIISFTTDPSMFENANGEESYYFNLEVWQDGGTITCHSFSDPFYLTVLPDPILYMQASHTIVSNNYDNVVTYNVNASQGHGEFHYAWYVDNVLQNSATDTSAFSYNTTNLTVGNHEFMVIVSQLDPITGQPTGYGCQTIASKTLTVTDQNFAVINTGAYNCETSTQELIADINPSESIAYYKWFTVSDIAPLVLDSNEVEIIGANGSTYLATESATYRVKAYYAGDVVAAQADRDVIIYPSFTVSINPSNNVNHSVGINGISLARTFTAVLSTGYTDTMGVTYQWYRNGQPINGANESSYTTDTTLAVGQYDYQVGAFCPQTLCTAMSGVVQANVAEGITVNIVGPTTTCPCETITFTAVVEDDKIGIESYQWRLEGNYITSTTPGFSFGPGANQIQYTVPCDLSIDSLMHEFDVVISRSGCEKTYSPVFNFFVTPAPVVVIEDQLLCEGTGSAVDLVANVYPATYEPYMYIWSNEAGTFVDTTLVNHISVTEIGQYFVTVKFLNTSCHAIVRSELANVQYIKQVSTVTANVYNICSGGEIELTATVQDQNGNNVIDPSLTYVWYKNGIIISGATTPWLREAILSIDDDTQTYTYEAAVYVANPNCVSARVAANPITVKRNPLVAITGEPLVCDHGSSILNINLSAWVDGRDLPGTYTWYLNGQYYENTLGSVSGQRLSDSRPYQYGYPYSYVVEYNNGNGCISRSEPFEVWVYEKPVVNITPYQDTVCVGGEVTLTAHLNNYNTNYMKYQWYKNEVPLGLIPGATERELTSVVSSSTNYIIEAIQLIDNGVVHACASYDTVQVYTYAVPQLTSISMSDTNFCEGGQLKLVANKAINTGYEGVPYVYHWTRNGIVMENAVGDTIYDTPVCVDGNEQTFTYSVYATQLGHEECSSNLVTTPAVVTVYPNPRVAISGNAHVCAIDSVFLIANVDTITRPIGSLNYTWYESGQIRDNMAYGLGNSQFFSEYFYPRTEPYSFTVEVHRAGVTNACRSYSAPFLVHVYEQPIVNITADQNEICQNGTATLTANLNDYNMGNLTYQWFEVREIIDTIPLGVENGQIIYLVDTTDEYTLIPGATQLVYQPTITDPNLNRFAFKAIHTPSGCEGFNEIELIVNEVPAITSISVLEGRDTVCQGGLITLQANLEGGVATNAVYTWYLNGQIIPGATQQTYATYPIPVDNENTALYYSVAVSQDANGCISKITDASTIMIVVKPNPTVQIVGNPIVCVDTINNVQLQANIFPAPDASLTYNWLIDNILSVNNSNSLNFVDHLAYRTEPYIIKFYSENNNGCASYSDEYYVYVNAAPIVHITANQTDICQNGEVTVTAHLADWNADQLTYQWYKQTENGEREAIAGATSLSYTTTLSDAGNVTFTFTVNQTSSRCNATSNELIVNVHAQPVVAAITVAHNLICEGGQVILEAPAADSYDASLGAVTYHWYKNGTEVINVSGSSFIDNPVIEGNNMNTYVYGLKVSLANSGCESNIIYDTVTIHPQPQVSVLVNGNATLCEGGVVKLSANVFPAMNEESPVIYRWLKDNAVMEGQEASMLIDTVSAREQAYHYSVLVMYGDVSQGCFVRSESQPITVVADPIVTITTDHMTICEGSVATLTANIQGGAANVNGIDPYIIKWYNQLSNNNPIGEGYEYIVPDTADVAIYSYWAVVESGDYGCTYRAQLDNFSIVPQPQVTIRPVSYADSIVCEHGTTTLEAIVEGGDANASREYVWKLNGDIVQRGARNVIETPELTVAGTFTYVVEVSQNDFVCTAVSAPFNPEVRALSVDLVGTTNVCQGGTAELTATVIGGVADNNYTYNWFKIENGVAQPIADAENATTYTTSEYTLQGTYSYFVVVSSNISGCTAPSATVNVNVVAKPVVTIHGASEICQGGDLPLTAFVQSDIAPNRYTYEWKWMQNGVQMSLIDTNNVFRPTQAIPPTTTTNPYYFTVKVVGHSGCISESNPFAVVIKPTAIVEVLMDKPFTCEGADVIFTARVIPDNIDYTYAWTANGQSIAGNNRVITMNNLAVDTNHVMVTVTPFNADSVCTASSVAVKPIVFAQPTVVISADNNLMCEGGSTMIRVENIDVHGSTIARPNHYKYEWTANGSLLSDAVTNSYRHNVSGIGTSTYRLRITQENDALGCRSEWSDAITINVIPQPKVSIAQGVTLTDICAGGNVVLTAMTANEYNPATDGFMWYVNNQSIGNTSKILYDTLHNVGVAVYSVKMTSTVHACNPAMSTNTVQINVNADPTWNQVMVDPSTMVCHGEELTLNATVQGGVMDHANNTNGIVKWYYTYENGTAQPISLGGTNVHYTPELAGYYQFIARYEGQLGSGCNLSDYTTQITVNPRPTATFTSGDGMTICSNDYQQIAHLVITLTGRAPFSFIVVNETTGEYQTINTNLTTYTYSVVPDRTSIYRIIYLKDANGCEAIVSDLDAAIVNVSNIQFTDGIYSTECGESDENGNAIVRIPFNVISGTAGTFTAEYLNTDYSVFNFSGDVAGNAESGYYLEFSAPQTPGNYVVRIRINECSYDITVRTLFSNQFATAQYGKNIIEQRWDDVVVVNNNIGGYKFVSYQWYRNGEMIPGATGQYYQEIGGLSGFYSVRLIAQDLATGKMIEYMTCDFASADTKAVKVYPVPAKTYQEITIELDLTEEELNGALLDIFDMKGALVQRINSVQPVTKVSGFAAQGTYFGRILTGTNEIKTVKFIIVK